MAKATLKLLIKSSSNEGLEHFVLKMESSGACMIPYLKEAFPDMKIIFNCRHPRDNLLSFMKVVENINLIYLLSLYSGLIDYTVPMPYEEPERMEMVKKSAFDSEFTGYGYYFAAIYYVYLKVSSNIIITLLKQHNENKFCQIMLEYILYSNSSSKCFNVFQNLH